MKGTFKDHLVDWITTYIKKKNTAAQGIIILADVDRRYAPQNYHILFNDFHEQD